jgi:hypothetical protein
MSTTDGRVPGGLCPSFTWFVESEPSRTIFGDLNPLEYLLLQTVVAKGGRSDEWL